MFEYGLSPLISAGSMGPTQSGQSRPFLSSIVQDDLIRMFEVNAFGLLSDFRSGSLKNGRHRVTKNVSKERRKLGCP